MMPRFQRDELMMRGCDEAIKASYQRDKIMRGAILNIERVWNRARAGGTPFD